MDYYKESQYLAQVDINDCITGRVERWLAHEQGILHRGFTVILTYKGSFVLQHRKHPAFNHFFDLTFSSHQLYKKKVLQNDEDAISETLKREWDILPDQLPSRFEFLGKIYYKAKDPESIYTEHEIDYIYKAELNNPPNPNPDFAYGYKLVNKNTILTQGKNSSLRFTPWVATMLRKDLIK